jgi:hypothetical protein
MDHRVEGFWDLAKVRSAMAVLLIGVMLLATSVVRADESDGGSSKIQVSFGPEEIWQPSDTALQALFGCQPQATATCVRQVMQADGASPDAVAFYSLTGWFLSDIMDTRPVRVATIMTPWRANENSQWALVGGVPAVIYRHRPLRPPWKSQHRQALF